MKKTIIVMIVSLSFCAIAQNREPLPITMSGVNFNSLGSFHYTNLYEQRSSDFYEVSGMNIKNNIVTKSKKSPGLAMLLSLIVPGTGQVYAGRFDVGKYFMISEASLWLTYASMTIYSNWLLNDAYNYAVIHAGIDKNGKSDQFFLDIANWDNVTEYNNDKLQTGQYNLLYYPENGWGFYWDQVSNRKQYRQDKLAGDRMKNDRLFIIGAVLVNHVISAISAIFVTNKYNEELNKSGGYALNADVMRFQNRADGIKLKLTKWF